MRLVILHEIVDRLAELGKTCFDWDKLLPLVQTNANQLLISSIAHLDRSANSTKLTQLGLPLPAIAPLIFTMPIIWICCDRWGQSLLFWSPLSDQNYQQAQRRYILAAASRRCLRRS
jgi:cobyrinic acid a,c-diamide synthase